MPSTATVIVKFKDPPGQGAKNWKIKGDDDVVYYLPPALADQVSSRGTYEVLYESNNFKGKTYLIVSAIKALGGIAQSSPSGGPGQTHGTGRNPNFERDMFVMAMMKSSLEGGLIKELKSDISTAAVRHWMYVWDQTLGAKESGQQYAADMDEMIPF
jgi:hypothetical protein